MKLKTISLKQFKRFTDLTIENLPESAKLIILIGPNGSGKTSLFEAFKQWRDRFGRNRYDNDKYYFTKDFSDLNSVFIKESIQFHNNPTPTQEEAKKSFYIRSAYRNEADFTISGLSTVGSALDNLKLARMIDNDAAVSDAYQRIVGLSIAQLYDGSADTKNVLQLRESIIGEIRDSLLRIFDDLILEGPGNPLNQGAFYFTKGTAKNFHYKNLSGGEKSAFDLITDLIIKKNEFNNTVYCIDEPDTHLNSKLQAKVLEELYSLIPDNGQLVVSTHSIGMMHKAMQMYKSEPNKVIFLDFHGINPDQPVVLSPAKITRELWKRNLSVAVDDISELISPKRIVICEGRPANLTGKNLEFDAQILRNIFNEGYPDTDFISVGNEKDVRTEKLDLVATLKILNKGVEFVKLIDRDDRSDQEVEELLQIEGVKVLKRRDIESYLLDDE